MELGILNVVNLFFYVSVMDNVYYIYIGDIVTELGSMDANVPVYRKCFDLIYNVAHYRKLWHESNTSEASTLALRSRKDAENALDAFMVDMQFDLNLRAKIEYVAHSPLSAS